ncbi:MAG: serine hydrolase, partial [Elusimicrobia bacterium]|nr:serine hydrolase [Elusimicrobiota bacterium]
GLGAAAPVRARGWVELDAAGHEHAPSAAEAKRLSALDSKEKQSLESLLDGRVKQLRGEGRLSPDERTAWTVYDFTTGEELVSINEDVRLQSASLVKPFLALAYFHEVEARRLRYDRRAREKMTLMIQRSDNRAADWVMRRLGGPARVQRLLKHTYPSMLKDLQIVEYIPRSGRTYRNKASARDYSRFLLALWRDALPGSKEIKRLMGLPKRDRIYSGTDLPEDTGVMSKTGSTRHLCGDMGVLEARTADGREYPYAIVGLIEKRAPARHYIPWLRSRGNVIRDISGLVYRSIGQLHGFAPGELAAR